MIGRVLAGRYRVERKLGQGGLGAVYAAVQLDLARPVAVKTLLDVQDERDLDRLRTEALAAASLSHPNIVQVSDFHAAKGDEPAFLVMELLPGNSLAEVLRARGRLSIATAVHIAVQMLEALAKAHEANILHRDVKPANVIVLDGPEPDAPWIKLVDFGIAKLMDDESRHTTTGTMLGTPAYMAPEQLVAKRATAAVDIYAAGVCVYEMIAGKRPFEQRGGELVAAVLRGAAPDIRLYADVPPAIATAIERAMSHEPSARFSSAKEMADALRNAQKAPPPAPAPTPKRWPLFVIAAVGSIVVAGGVVAVAASSHHEVVDKPAADVRATVPAPDVDVVEDASDVTDVAPPEPGAVGSERPDARGTGLVRSYCNDGRNILCSSVRYYCECRDLSLHATVCSQPQHPCPQYVVENDRVDRHDDDACSGYLWSIRPDGGAQSERANGKFVCMVSCGYKEQRASARMAIPGTPCNGYFGVEARKGKWVPVAD